MEKVTQAGPPEKEPRRRVLAVPTDAEGRRFCRACGCQHVIAGRCRHCGRPMSRGATVTRRPRA